MSDETISTDVPDAESVADELARLRGVVRDLLALLRVTGVARPAVISPLEDRLGP